MTVSLSAYMQLADLYRRTEDSYRNAEVRGLAYATSQVSPGSLFFCVRGFTRDGHDFAPEAIAKGAVALVVDHPLNLGVPEVIVDNVRAAMAPAAANFYGDPTKDLQVVGVTGNERQDDDRVPRPRTPRGGPPPDGPARDGQVDHRRRDPRGRPDDP